MASFKRQANKLKQNLKNNMLKAALVIEKEAHAIVAIKTGELDQSITTGSVEEVVPGVFKIDIGSREVNYAKFVEFGVQGRIYNYHRNGEIVFRGVGQRFMERALDNKKSTVLGILKGSNVRFKIIS